MGTETIVNQNEGRLGLCAAIMNRGRRMFQRASRRAHVRKSVSVATPAVAKDFTNLGLVTSSVNDHAHALHAFVDSEDERTVVVGETSLSTGDAENKPPHSHPFTLNLETGELRIAEADDHVHSVDAEELASALETMRERLADDGVTTPMLRSDDRGPGMRQERRRLSNAEVGFVSLCRRGMNGVRTLMKSDGRFSLTSSLSKMDREGLLHTLVWVPDLPCHEGDTMTAEEVRKMAHGFLPNGGRIDIEHDGKPLSSDQVSVAEHYIVPPGDPKFKGILTSEGTEIDPTGAWGLILKIQDPAIRADYESGDWDGVSLAGRAEVTPVGKSEAPNTPKPPTEDDFDMTPEERKEFAKDIAEQVANGLATVLKQNAPASPPAEPEPVSQDPAIEPPEDLDLNDPESLEKWMDELFVRSLDLTKRDDVAKLAKHRRDQAAKKAKADAEIAKANATPPADGDGDGDGAETELEKAKREAEEAKARVDKLEKASRQSAKPDDDEPASRVAGLNKSESDQWQLGKDIAKRMTERRSAVA